jgi:hypothetical protein
MSVNEIGCCGAYCRTCPVMRQGACGGCKIGYRSGDRDLTKARCKIKVCCIQKGFNSCADCDGLDSCETIQGFYGKKGYKYRKYREAVEFIREHGYNRFLIVADGWKNQLGPYPKNQP